MASLLFSNDYFLTLFGYIYRISANQPELFQPGENSQELNGAVFKRLAIFFELGSIPIISKYLTAYSY